MTISAVAEYKKIRLKKIDVHIKLRVDKRRPPVSFFEVEIDLGTGLNKWEQMVLFNVARSCEVRKILSGEKTFDYKLINGEQSEKAA